MVSAKDFIAKIEEIAAEEPGYLEGHSGTDGYCDCIGLIIGAIRRAGGTWSGTHGSNYARRHEMDTFEQIHGAEQLQPGEVVYKSREPGTTAYALPTRYRKGGADFTGDLRDYCHIGVVISSNPLRIRHMTSPKPKMDTRIDKWKWHGKLKKIDYGGEKPMPTESYQARVLGGKLNLRKGPSSATVRITQIPEGSIVTVTGDGGEWCAVDYQGQTGYVMSRFLEKMDGSSGDNSTITVDRMRLEAVYDELGDLLGLRG